MFTLSTDCAFANWSLVDEEERWPPSCRFDVCLVDRAESVCDPQGSVVLRMDERDQAGEPKLAKRMIAQRGRRFCREPVAPGIAHERPSQLDFGTVAEFAPRMAARPVCAIPDPKPDAAD